MDALLKRNSDTSNIYTFSSKDTGSSEGMHTLTDAVITSGFSPSEWEAYYKRHNKAPLPEMTTAERDAVIADIAYDKVTRLNLKG